jgi:molybdenum cofactor cytidylyltransferase
MIPIIILAAGKSTRMKENKLLRRINGATLVEQVVDNAVRSNADETIVVLGYEAEKTREKLARLDCTLVVNDRYDIGQSESVKAGLSAVGKDSEAVMILPADVALIDALCINRVIDEYRSSGSRIVVASYQNQSGHPILLDRSLFPEISKIDEDTFGLKAVIDRHRSEIRYVDVNTVNVLIDIDTEDEFRRYFGKSTD